MYAVVYHKLMFVHNFNFKKCIVEQCRNEPTFILFIIPSMNIKKLNLLYCLYYIGQEKVVLSFIVLQSQYLNYSIIGSGMRESLRPMALCQTQC